MKSGLALEKQNLLPEPTVEPSVFVVALGDAAKVEAFKICQALHDEYITVEMDGQGKSMKAQLKYANKINAKYVIILGDDELVRKEAIIRFMDTSEQETVSLNIVAERITSLVNIKSMLSITTLRGDSCSLLLFTCIWHSEKTLWRNPAKYLLWFRV